MMMKFRHFLRESHWKDYRRNWRGMTAKYDNDHFDTEQDILRNDDNKPIAYKTRLNPKPHVRGFAGDVIPNHEDIIHRGMSHQEYNNIKKSGKIQSYGKFNIGSEQEGLTYYTSKSESAGSYATNFAQKKHKPTPQHPSYIVSVKKPSPNRIKHVEGTDSHEVGVIGHINTSDIVAIHKANVIAHDPNDKGVGNYINWEKLDHKKELEK